jgi:hypothetical protein
VNATPPPSARATTTPATPTARAGPPTTWAARPATAPARPTPPAPPAAPPEPTPNRRLGTAHEQVDQCASCHARRTRLVEDAAPAPPPRQLPARHPARRALLCRRPAEGRSLRIRLLPPEPHVPGRRGLQRLPRTPRRQAPRQRQRPVHQCHNASASPRFKGLQAKDYDSPAHHFHSPGQAGSQCVDCHMPSTNYMVVHGRRDHAIRIPQPALSAGWAAPTPAAAATPTAPPTGPPPPSRSTTARARPPGTTATS